MIISKYIKHDDKEYRKLISKSKKTVKPHKMRTRSKKIYRKVEQVEKKKEIIDEIVESDDEAHISDDSDESSNDESSDMVKEPLLSSLINDEFGGDFFEFNPYCEFVSPYLNKSVLL